MAEFVDDDDLSEEELEAVEVTSWLEEEDPEEEERPKKLPVPVEPGFDIQSKPLYIQQNLDLFHSLCQLDDWEFERFPDELQVEMMKTLTIQVYQPGEAIIREGDVGNDLYIVTASEQTSMVAEVEVVNQNILEGSEVFLTRLRRGQYFGQKYFVTRRVNKRSATVRVPKDLPVPVAVAKLTDEHFEKWDSFRHLLLVKTVPLFQKLPRKARIQILQHLQVREFKDGEYICTQGEKGEHFFIIQEGTVKVVEKRPSPDKGWEAPLHVVLTTLREGHFFGEMSLVTDEPRVASVISVKNTICLSLSKSEFRAALSDEAFTEVLTEVLLKRQEIRKQREKELQEETQSAINSPAGNTIRKMSGRSRGTSSVSEVSVSTTLSMKRESGLRMINKYIIEKELGKGSFGEVFLVRVHNSDEYFAMKRISRPSTSWNDEASNVIRQEIAVMKRLKHENVVALHEVIDDQNASRIYLIQEYMDGGPLMGDSENCDPIEQSLARQYFRDILRGLCYLHSEGVVHRDIKPQNMLKTKEGKVKIADFGAAVFTGGIMKPKVTFGGTPAFMAPELSNPNLAADLTVSQGIDIFALGVTLYCMIVGRPPWMANNQIDLATKIQNFELTFPAENVDPHIKNLVKNMTAKNYILRWTLDQIIADDWVTNEGTEPVFEKDKTLVHDFIDFDTVLRIEQQEQSFQPPLKILLVHPSLVTRTMLHNAINFVAEAICVSAVNVEEAIDIMQNTLSTHPEANFDFIFCEIFLPQKESILHSLHIIRAMGYNGRIIGMTDGKDVDLHEVLCDNIVNCIVRRPIPHRALEWLLDSEHNGEVDERITAEEFEAAITFRRDEFSSSRSNSVRSSYSLSYSDQDAEAMNEGEEQGTVDSNRFSTRTAASELLSKSSSGSDQQFPMPKDETAAGNGHVPRLPRQLSSPQLNAEEDDDANVEDFETANNGDILQRPVSVSIPTFPRNSIQQDRGLVRKSGFMVLPSGASHDSNDNPPGSMIYLDRPLKIMPVHVKERRDRREKREAAMRKAELAHQYRIAKKAGNRDAMQSTKSMMHLLRIGSKKSIVERKSSTSVFSDRSHGSPSFYPSQPHGSHFSMGNPQLRSAYGGGGSSGRASPAAPSGLAPATAVSMRHIDQFIGNTVEDAAGELDSIEDIGDADDESDDDEENLEDESSDDEDLDLSGGIRELDAGALDDEFESLIRKRPESTMEIQEWDHIVAYVTVSTKLKVSARQQENAVLGLRYAKAESIVSRNYMEDRSLAVASMPRRVEEARPPLALFAVFDGHSGEYVAQALQDKYGETFSHFLRSFEDQLYDDIIDISGGQYESYIQQIFEQTTAALDLELLARDYVRQQKSLRNGIQDMQNFAGSVAVVTAIMPAVYAMPDEHGRRPAQVFVSHVGDCRAVLSQDGQAVQLTEDHKANCKTEKTRIELAGGWVQNGRVNGALGVARSIGDIQFKNCSECDLISNPSLRAPSAASTSQPTTPNTPFLATQSSSSSLQAVEDLHKVHESLWGEHQQVISKPDFQHFVVEGAFEFMILASDGLWDVFTCQEAVNFVRKKLLTTSDLEVTAKELINKAISRGTQDNTSVIIVAFHQEIDGAK